ncbi:hypothetical protein [Rhizobium rhizogenes]|jgi:hypothetical protein|uniref:hypothetical protein n=1 Tax=Rhizobium rhizogenes TaxID=359 RepID=UPI000647EB4E|nr:hypothetical protein [Rhizobium rhizogenes]
MAKFTNARTKDALSPSRDVRTRQALDQAAGGSGDIDSVTSSELTPGYAEPGTDDSRSVDTPESDSQRSQAVDKASGRIAAAVLASRPRKRHATRSAAMLAIGGLAGFLLHSVIAGR